MAKKLNLLTGFLGEKIVVEYLKSKGFSIITKNFRSKLGEIDIIGKQGETVVFFEVKTRRTLKFGQPYEAVNTKKLNRIRKTINYFLLLNPAYKNKKLRIDVISLLLDETNHVKEIKHFENVGGL